MKNRLKTFLLFAGCLSLMILSCDEIDVLDGQPTDIIGVWELDKGSGSVEYLSVTEDSLTFVYVNSQSSCPVIDAYEIISADESGFYTLLAEGEEEPIVLAISPRDGEIHVRNVEESSASVVRYHPSSQDISEFDDSCVVGEVFGSWQLQGNTEDFVLVTISPEIVQVTYYDFMLGCYQTDSIEVLSINGDVFTLEDNSPESLTGEQDVTVRLIDEGVIEIVRTEQGETIAEIYGASDIDPESLTPVCSGEDIDILTGVWQRFNNDNTSTSSLRVLEITTETLKYFTYKGNPNFPSETDCFDVFSYDVVLFNDGEMEIGPSGTQDPLTTLSFSFQDGLLEVDTEGEIENYFPIGDTNPFLNDVCPEPTKR